MAFFTTLEKLVRWRAFSRPSAQDGRESSTPTSESAGPILLSRGQISILPTRLGLIFGLFLLAIMLAGINYENNLIFLFTFLLGSAAIVSVLHTYRNLRSVRIQTGRCDPVFAGQKARFTLCLDTLDGNPKPAIRLLNHDSALELDLTPGAMACGEMMEAATRRGRLPLGSVRIETRYPLGLFKARSTVQPGSTCLVYPRPMNGTVPMPPHRDIQDQSLEHVSDWLGTEEFKGIREYRAGDSFRRVLWKTLSKGQEPLTKEFLGSSAKVLWLELDEQADDLEFQLSRLTRMVLEADAAGTIFGLAMPGKVIEPDRGEAHKRRCLTELALY
jgi:uncharacterized protein (DUF58 family)